VDQEHQECQLELYSVGDRQPMSDILCIHRPFSKI